MDLACIDSFYPQGVAKTFSTGQRLPKFIFPIKGKRMDSNVCKLTFTLNFLLERQGEGCAPYKF